ncbi:MAG TPA: ABC transporter substrate-binding protein [Candidatus Binataceae bacterium]|nr:ABC transporter substrate-binding protein [Candidatus Binataceae bacterium]
MNAPRALSLLATAWVCAMLAGGCARSTSAKPPGYIQVDIETSPTSTDPRFSTDAISSRVNELVFDSLVRIDQTGNFTGDLAESIERPSATRIVFHLRRGVRFADGRELTARDVKFTYDSILAPESLSPKRAAMQPLAAIDAPDDYTVVMDTREPYAPALELAMEGIVPAGTPLPRLAVAPAPPGAGPFRMASYSRDEAVVLERNPDRAEPPGAARGIIFKVVPDPTVRALELMEGVCDLVENNIQYEVIPYLGARPNLVVDKSPGTAYQYLAFNFRDRRLGDLRVRRAIAYAIDRETIVRSYLRANARVATGMLSPENWAYDGAVTAYGYDPGRARRLLDEAGYPPGPDGMRKLKFEYKTTPEGARLAEVFQAMLRRVGIGLEVRTLEFATFYADIQRGNYDLTSMQWVGINDPNHYYMVFDSRSTPPNGFNRGSYSNLQMDRLLEAGSATIDPQMRRRIYADVQQLAAEDLPYVSLWWQDNVAVMNRALAGFVPYPNGSLRSLAAIRLAGASEAEPGE